MLRSKSGSRVHARIPGISRVVVVTDSFPTPAQPCPGKSNLEMLRHLNEMVDVQVVCPFPRYPHWLRPKWHEPADPEFLPEGIHAHYLQYPALPVISRAMNGLTCARYAEPFVRALKPDVILNFWIYPAGFAAVRLGRALGAPVIAGSIGSDLHRIPDLVSRWLSSWTVRKADFVITKSHSLREHAVRLGAKPERVRVIQNGCDRRIFFVADRLAGRRELAVPADARLILYVGRLDVRKGVGELAKAFFQLAADDPRLRLVYVGSGPDERTIRRLAQTHPAGSRIWITGRLDQPAVARWLAACNVLALPSYSEGCPNVVLEALSCGRPVVATHVGGIPEVMNQHCGELIPPRDVPALAGALHRVLNGQWDEQLLTRQCRRDFHTMAKEVLEICELVAQRPLGKKNGKKREKEIGAMSLAV